MTVSKSYIKKIIREEINRKKKYRNRKTKEQLNEFIDLKGLVKKLKSKLPILTVAASLLFGANASADVGKKVAERAVQATQSQGVKKLYTGDFAPSDKAVDGLTADANARPPYWFVKVRDDKQIIHVYAVKNQQNKDGTYKRYNDIGNVYDGIEGEAIGHAGGPAEIAAEIQKVEAETSKITAKLDQISKILAVAKKGVQRIEKGKSPNTYRLISGDVPFNETVTAKSHPSLVDTIGLALFEDIKLKVSEIDGSIDLDAAEDTAAQDASDRYQAHRREVDAAKRAGKPEPELGPAPKELPSGLKSKQTVEGNKVVVTVTIGNKAAMEKLMKSLGPMGPSTSLARESLNRKKLSANVLRRMVKEAVRNRV